MARRVTGRSSRSIVQPSRIRTAVVLSGTVLALALAGCASASGSATYAPGQPCTTHLVPDEGQQCSGTGQIVDVTLKNFAIVLPASLPTGAVTFRIRGAGPTLHEFNIARSVLDPEDLPLASDDTVDDTKNTPRFTWIAQIEGIDVGDVVTLTTDITPGHYVFYCNMDGHYMAGMSAQATAA